MSLYHPDLLMIHPQMMLAVIPDQLYPSEHWYIDLMLPTSFVLVGYKVNQHPH